MDKTNEELRLEIAKAKGWKMWNTYYKNTSFLPLCPEDKLDVEVGFEVEWVTSHPRLYWQTGDPNWPENIAAAWELVEEIPLVEAVKVERTEKNEPHYWCAIVKGDDWYTGEAETAPRAICLAWLEWKKAQS